MKFCTRIINKKEGYESAIAPIFQNILERKLSNCFGQLLYMYQEKCLWRVYILDIPELYCRFFNEYLAIQADDEFDSLLVCNII